METKFTKGKWGMHKHGVSCVSVGDRIIANCGAYYNSCDYERIREENEANAKLCSAAPDMLEALQTMITEMHIKDACRGKWSELSGDRNEAYVGSKDIPSDESILKAIEAINKAL